MQRLALVLIGAVCALGAVPGTAGAASGVTQAGSDERTGWYPNQSALSPDLVGGTSFGQLFRYELPGADDQVDAQPLVHENTLLVASEANTIVGLDPRTGAERWKRSLGTAMRTGEATTDASPGCIVPPNTGVTGTPVIDPATDTVYLFSKRYVIGTSGPIAYYAHALDVATGAERPGFPVKVDDFVADNHPNIRFESQWELQRPGLLLSGGVVYAAFAGHCDKGPYEGWVVGVSTQGGPPGTAIKAKWSAVGQTPGAGIWQSGGGLMSDGPGRIFFIAGNGRVPSGTIPGDQPPGNLGEAVVRLQVGSDGRLAAEDFFAPFDAQTLEANDVDFGSGGPIALPDESFGSQAFPHLMLAVGKQGTVYILDRDRLGGIGMGAGGGDAVVRKFGPFGGVWSRPSVWPGTDGSYIWVNTASGGGNVGGGGTGKLKALRYGVDTAGRPSLVDAATSEDGFSIDSGQPVVTSDGSRSGSGLLWIVQAPYNGFGGELRAYQAVPSNGRPVLLRRFPIGRSSKFQAPGVAAGRLYVTSREYTDPQGVQQRPAVYGFGSPVSPALSGQSLSFPNTEVGRTAQRTETFTATRALAVESLTSSGGAFALGAPSRALPATLAAGESITLPVTFRPSVSGPAGASLTARVRVAGSTTEDIAISLAGTGVNAGPELALFPEVVSFGGALVGEVTDSSFSVSNVGASALTLAFTAGPAAGSPFRSSQAIPAFATIPAGESRIVPVSFAPTREGDFQATIELRSNGGDETVVLSGSAGTPGRLVITPPGLDFGRQLVGGRTTLAFELANAGGSALQLTRYFPPSEGQFSADASRLTEGSTLAPGERVAQGITFAPKQEGTFTDAFDLNATDGQGRRQIPLTGVGGAPEPNAASQPTPAGGGAPQVVPTPPPGVLRQAPALARLSQLRVGAAQRGSRRRTATYRLSAASRVRFSVERQTRRGRPFRPSPGVVERNGRAGRNLLRFDGRIGSRRLAAGRYRLVAVPVAADGRRGPASRVSFSLSR